MITDARRKTGGRYHYEATKSEQKKNANLAWYIYRCYERGHD